MPTIFIGRWLKGFGRFINMTTKLRHKPTETEKRERILFFWQTHGLAATQAAFNVSRSTLFLWKKKQKNNDLKPKSRRPRRVRVPTTPSEIITAVCDLRRALPFLGKAKLVVILKRRGLTVSASTVGRIIKKRRLPRAPKLFVARKRKAVRRLRKPTDYEITAPGDLIGFDTITVQDKGRKRYLITAVDYFTRIAVCRAYDSPSSANAGDLLKRMQIVLGAPIKAVNTDNGSEFLKNFEQACQQAKPRITHFFTYPRSPKMNPLAERFNRTIQEEAELPLVENSLSTWNRFVAHYIMLYNFFRPHYSLDYLTPVEKFLGSKKSNMLWTHTQYP